MTNLNDITEMQALTDLNLFSDYSIYLLDGTDNI